MASKRGQRRRACTGKRRYDTQDQAFTAMMGLVRKKGNAGVGGYMTPYHCRFCHGYHFGHTPARVRERMGR